MAELQHFCVVGLGAHARTKLIPALEANGQQVVAVVSGQPPDALNGKRVFPRLEIALELLADDTAFLIATPPHAHFRQIKAVVEAGRDVVVEKPAFVTRRDAEEISRLCEPCTTVVAEAFMHRHTALYARLLTFWAARRERVRRLEMRFLIAEAPVGTFRQDAGIASSSLFDIGCYPVSLLADLGLALAPLQVEDVAFPGIADKERVRLAGVLGDVEVKAEIGVGPGYANSVTIGLDGDESIRLEPFFYGRKGARSITRTSDSAAQTETFDDHNGLETMLGVTREAWLAGQQARLVQMVEVAGKLESLGRQVVARRVGV